MFESRSAIESAYQVGRIGPQDGVIGITIRERRDKSLVQVSGWPENFGSVCERLAAVLKCQVPVDMRRATSLDDNSMFRIAPERLWVTGPPDDVVLSQLNSASLGDEAVVTEIGHSRTVLRISGRETETLLSRGLPIDLNSEVFPANAFAQSAVHHMSVLVHRVGNTGEIVFDVYVSRDLAITFWEWLTEAAAPLGCEIMHPE